MAYNYTSFYKDLNVTSDELIAEFERRQLETPASLIDLSENGCHYTNQDFDVMAHAIRLLAGGNDFEHVYAEIFGRRHTSFTEQELARCQCGHTSMGHIQGLGACLHFLSSTPNASCECKRFESALPISESISSR